jgi:hypothetical protein
MSESTTDLRTDLRTREQRARRAAARQRLRLEKSRTRDPRALDYGTFQLVDADTGALVAVGSRFGYGLSLDGVERELDKGRTR